MAKIANVALTNTFDTWRSRSNEAFDRLSQFAINNSSLYANTLTANASFRAKGTSVLQGGVTMNRSLVVNNNITVSGNTTITGLATASGRLTVGTNLTVSGNTTITGLTTASGRLTVGTNLTVSGNTTLGGASKTITMGGAASTLTIGGAGHTTNTTGWFGVTGRASVSTNLFVGANTVINGRLGIGTTSPGDAISVARSTGEAVISITNSGTASSWLILAPGSAGSAYIHNTGNVPTIFTTNSVEAFRLASSGLGTFAKSVAITNNLTVSGNTTINGTTIDKSNTLAQTLTDGATINWDVALGRVATVTLGATGRTMAAPTNLKVGTYILRVYQDGTGSRTITTWNAVFKWTAAVAPVLSTGANKLDIITFFSDGTNLYGSYLPDMR